jgi:hypothetical protein
MIFWASLLLDKPITGKHMADRVNNRGGTSRMENDGKPTYLAAS